MSPGCCGLPTTPAGSPAGDWESTKGRVACASLNLLAKKPDHWSKGMVLCVTVEFYAILSLLASMLMIINISK